MPVFDIFKRFVGTAATASERRGDDRVRASLGARVLVVDDSATIRAVLGKMLSQDGYEVLKAPDGENAVEMAQSQFPDLIFLDIVLPGMSGFAVLRALRRDTRTRTTPIIMMSGNQQATEQFYVQRFGADGFIKKPFGRAEVFHSIRSLVQAGRMGERLDAPSPDAIPDGMTPEEWESIPDVAMPDEAHAAGHPVVLDAGPAETHAVVAPQAAVGAPAVPEAASEVAAVVAAPSDPAVAQPVVSEPVIAREPVVATESMPNSGDAAPVAPERADAVAVPLPAVAEVPVVAEAPVEAAPAAAPAADPVQVEQPAHPVQAAIPFEVATPAEVHPAEKSGFSAFWSLRTLGMKMRPSVTTVTHAGHAAGVPLTPHLPPSVAGGHAGAPDAPVQPGAAGEQHR